MNSLELIEKCDAALAACLDMATKMAKGEQPNGAFTLADAALKLCDVHLALRCRQEESGDT